jgi:glycerol uptake facilitator-like aquaporin
MTAILTGEFLGTAVLILLGGGVCAATSLERSFARNAGWIVVSAGWACAVICGIFVATACGAPGALNPIGPVLDMVNGSRPALEALAMVLAETAGRLLWCHTGLARMAASLGCHSRQQNKARCVLHFSSHPQPSRQSAV